MALPTTTPTAQPTPRAPRTKYLTFGQVTFIAIVLGAFLIRVWNVGGRAMHLDESTVAWFAWQLLIGHGYSYNPVYHGPFQHQMLALIFFLFEPSQTSARMLAVVMGTGLVALPWFLRDYLGRTVALWACLLLAISPSFVYFARFERDDTYMEFFTFLLVVFALRFLRDRKPYQLYGAVIAFALAFATKESIYIVAFIFGTFLAFRWVGFALAARFDPSPLLPPNLRRVLTRPATLALCLLTPLVLALILTINTGLYLPVPLVLVVILAGGVVVSSARLRRRRTEVSEGLPFAAADGSAAGTEAQPRRAELQGCGELQDSGHAVDSNQPRDSGTDAEGRPYAVTDGSIAGRGAQPRMGQLQGSGELHGSQPPRNWMWEREWRTHWINALTIALGVIILMYSTFGTNLNGLWDQAHPFFNTGNVCQYPLAFNLDACRQDIVGGLFYWLSQHKVARGGQPWYYFLLIFGLYEQIAIVFACIGGLVTFVSRRVRPSRRALRMFVVYWATLSVLVYSWAGEKFPWLGIHPLLPMTLLAAIGIGDVIQAARLSRRPNRMKMSARAPVWQRVVPAAGARLAMTVLAGLLIIEIHNTFALNFADGANPVEMMVYVQSSPNTITDANLIGRLSHRVTGGDTLDVSIDNPDTWPFAWYLRNMPNVGYPSGAAATISSRARIIILDQTDAQSMPLPAWLTTGYTRSLRRLDWWFPEDYKQWTWSSFLGRVTSPSSWTSIWNWETNRTAFGPRAGTWYYLYVKKGYFPAF